MSQQKEERVERPKERVVFMVVETLKRMRERGKVMIADKIRYDKRM